MVGNWKVKVGDGSVVTVGTVWGMFGYMIVQKRSGHFSKVTDYS